MSTAPACVRCGVCCTSDSLTHARVTGDDYARLGVDAERVSVWINNRVFMRMEARRCIALITHADGGFTCGVYATRPDVCRDLERGSPGCEGELARKTASTRRDLPQWRASDAEAEQPKAYIEEAYIEEGEAGTRRQS